MAALGVRTVYFQPARYDAPVPGLIEVARARPADRPGPRAGHGRGGLVPPHVRGSRAPTGPASTPCSTLPLDGFGLDIESVLLADEAERGRRAAPARRRPPRRPARRGARRHRPAAGRHRGLRHLLGHVPVGRRWPRAWTSGSPWATGPTARSNRAGATPPSTPARTSTCCARPPATPTPSCTRWAAWRAARAPRRPPPSADVEAFLEAAQRAGSRGRQPLRLRHHARGPLGADGCRQRPLRASPGGRLRAAPRPR